MTRRGARGASRHHGTFALGLLATAALSLTCSCSDYGLSAPQGADTVSVGLSARRGGGRANLFLYRITSRETGERLDVGRTFVMAEDRQARAVLQFDGISPETPLLVHIMWINPDGKELFTKEIRVTAADWRSAARRDTLARSLVYVDPDARRVEIESRMGISPARLEEEFHKEEERRSFKAGLWEVRTYLFRKRLLDTTFELLSSE